jgi:hypothetical protein
MLLCEIAGLSRLSITIVSLTGFPTPQEQTQQIRKEAAVAGRIIP